MEWLSHELPNIWQILLNPIRSYWIRSRESCHLCELILRPIDDVHLIQTHCLIARTDQIIALGIALDFHRLASTNDGSKQTCESIKRTHHFLRNPKILSRRSISPQRAHRRHHTTLKLLRAPKRHHPPQLCHPILQRNRRGVSPEELFECCTAPCSHDIAAFLLCSERQARGYRRPNACAYRRYLPSLVVRPYLWKFCSSIHSRRAELANSTLSLDHRRRGRVANRHVIIKLTLNLTFSTLRARNTSGARRKTSIISCNGCVIRIT